MKPQPDSRHSIAKSYAPTSARLSHPASVRASAKAIRRPAEQKVDFLEAFFIGLVLLVAVIWTQPASAQSCPPLLNYSHPSLQTGEAQNLCQYQGKVILVVNTASYCGHTDQYAGLEALYREYRGQGLVVLGFPSNDFGQQEPGTDKQIAKFCRLTYGVEFPMFSKTSVIGVQRSSLYAELASRTGVAPRWNFHKYLIDRTGSRVQSFESAVKPDDKQLLQAVKTLLKAQPKPARTT